MLKQVPTVRTNFTIKDLIKALCQGWQNVYGQLPKKEQIGVMFSQWSLETGQGNSCWCNNLGNIKAVDDPNATIEYCALTGVWEIINGAKVILPATNPGSWFRAFPTLAEGVAFYIDFLKNHRYKTAWTAVESGNPAAFAHLLKLAYSYTAPEADYVKSINYYFNKYMKDNTFETIINELTPAQVIIDPTTGNVAVPDNGQAVPTQNNSSGFFDTIKKIFS